MKLERRAADRRRIFGLTAAGVVASLACALSACDRVTAGSGTAMIATGPTTPTVTASIGVAHIRALNDMRGSAWSAMWDLVIVASRSVDLDSVTMQMIDGTHRWPDDRSPAWFDDAVWHDADHRWHDQGCVAAPVPVRCEPPTLARDYVALVDLTAGVASPSQSVAVRHCQAWPNFR